MSPYVEQLAAYAPAYARAFAFAALAAIGLLTLERRRRAVSGFFAQPGHPVELAVARIVVFATLLFAQGRAQLIAISALPDALQTPPVGWDWLPHLPVDPRATAPLMDLFRVACLLALVGLCTRAAALTAALLGVYLLGLPNFYGEVCHNHHLLWFAAILALSPSGDALSLDAWRARRRGLLAPGPSPAHGFPIRAMQASLGLIYFFPGLWKLSGGWLDWLDGDRLISIMHERWQVVGTPIVRADLVPALAAGIAVATVLFELAAPFLVLWPRGRLVMLVLGLSFHNGAGYLLGIPFFELQAMYVVLVDWRWLGRARAPAAADGRRGRALHRFVLALLSLLVILGLLHVSPTWPVACYPTFDGPRSGLTRGLLAVAHHADGSTTSQELDGDGAMGERLGAARWNNVVVYALRHRHGLEPRTALDGPHARALWQVWVEQHPVPPDVVSVELVAVERRWSPGEPPVIVHRRRLAIVSVPA